MTDGWTALMFAARVGNIDTVQALLGSRANVNLHSCWGGRDFHDRKFVKTALSLAIEGKYVVVIALLRAHGASV